MSFNNNSNYWNRNRVDYSRPRWCPQAVAFVRSHPQLLRQRPQIVAYIRRMCGNMQIPIPRPPRPIPPRPYPTPTPAGGCGPGRRFDSCGCRCVAQDAVTPQCIRNCTSCGVDQVFNWCVMQCVPAASKMKQCPPLDGSGVGGY